MGNELSTQYYLAYGSADHYSSIVASTCCVRNETEGQTERKREKILMRDQEVVSFFQELGMPTSFFEDEKCQAWKLSSTDPDYYRIHKYVENSQELAFGVKILNILKIIPNAYRKPPRVDFKDNPQVNGKYRKMLFHGTKTKHLQSILEKGLRLPQDDTAGIFFGDRVSKSCFYIDNGDAIEKTGKQGYLLLCDVLLDSMYTGHLRYGARAAPPMEIFNIFGLKMLRHCQSVFSQGIRIPDPKDNVIVDGCEWPLGKTIFNWDYHYNFNEYMIYDAKQVQPKFLLKIEFTPEPYHPVFETGKTGA